MNQTTAISFEDVSFVFDDKTVIKNFSTQIKDGEHICLMGESGAGKTTLLNSIVGLVLPSNGRIKVLDLELNYSNIKKIRKEISWFPQELNLPFEFPNEIIENIFSLKNNKNLIFNKDKMFEYFTKVGLEKEIFEQPFQKFSGGERQRFLLIVSLLLDKKILLMDEPTSALDINTRDKVLDFLQTFSNTTILAISHDEQVAKSFDRTILIK